MRLKPPVTFTESLAWLKDQAVSTWGIEITPEVAEMLTPMAEAMVDVSAASIPDDIEPLML